MGCMYIVSKNGILSASSIFKVICDVSSRPSVPPNYCEKVINTETVFFDTGLKHAVSHPSQVRVPVEKLIRESMS